MTRSVYVLRRPNYTLGFQFVAAVFVAWCVAYVALGVAYVFLPASLLVVLAQKLLKADWGVTGMASLRVTGKILMWIPKSYRTVMGRSR